MTGTKPFTIEKKEIWEAFQHVNANQGAAGVDGQTLESFGERLGPNLYKLWNRMSSGSYMPSPVRRVIIPKADGGERPLGIPTVMDRIAQEVIRLYLEPLVEPIFHSDSYGYRPERSAIDAIRTAKRAGSGGRSKTVSLNAACNFTSRRQRSSTAGIPIERAVSGRSPSTSSVTGSSPGWRSGAEVCSAYPTFRPPAPKLSRRSGAGCAIGDCSGVVTRG